MPGPAVIHDSDDPLTGPAAVDDDHLYVVRRRDVVALDLTAGDVAWTYRPGFYCGDGGVALADGTLYVGAHDDRVAAVDAATGRPRWRFHTRGGRSVPADAQVLPSPGFDGGGPYSPVSGGSVQATPTVADDRVVVGADDGVVYALGVADGGERWAVETGSRVWSRAAVADLDGGGRTAGDSHSGTVYVGSNDGNLYALALGDGTQRWAYPFAEGVVAAPVPVVDGDGTRHAGVAPDRDNPVTPDEPDAVVAGGLDGTVAALDPDRTERWRASPGGPVVSLAVAAGTVYVAGDDLVALDLADGDESWRAGVESRGDTPPTVADGTVAVGTDDGRAVALDAATGRRRWVVDADDAVTVLARTDDRLVVGDRAGTVRSMPRPR